MHLPRDIDHVLDSDELSLDQPLVGTAVDFVERSTGFLGLVSVQKVERRVWKERVAGQQDGTEDELQEDHDLVRPLIGSSCTEFGGQRQDELPKHNRAVDDAEKSTSDFRTAHFSDENGRD